MECDEEKSDDTTLEVDEEKLNDLPPLKDDEGKVNVGKELKTLTSNKLNQTSVLLAQIKTGNNS